MKAPRCNCSIFCESEYVLSGPLFELTRLAQSALASASMNTQQPYVCINKHNSAREKQNSCGFIVLASD